MKWPGANMFVASLFVLITCTSAAHAQSRTGIGGPVTGPEATFWAQLRLGVEQAVEDINASGGILGQQLIVSAGNDLRSDTDLAA